MKTGHIVIHFHKFPSNGNTLGIHVLKYKYNRSYLTKTGKKSAKMVYLYSYSLITNQLEELSQASLITGSAKLFSQVRGDSNRKESGVSKTAVIDLRCTRTPLNMSNGIVYWSTENTKRFSRELHCCCRSKYNCSLVNGHCG